MKASESSEIHESDPLSLLSLESYSLMTYIKTSRPQDFTASLSMVWPHELFSVIYTHYRPFFFKYIAPATEIIDKFWEQVAGV